nr:uncharacterized protein LOC110152205 isoform X2 [Odocoileus virginianus texanus]
MYSSRSKLHAHHGLPWPPPASHPALRMLPCQPQPLCLPFSNGSHPSLCIASLSWSHPCSAPGAAIHPFKSQLPGTRDCGLQDTSWSKEVLDRLYTSNFAVKVSLSRRSGWSPRPSDSRLAVLPPWGAGAWSVMLAASGCQMLAQPPVHKPSDASRADPCYCHKPQHPTLRLRAGAKPRATLTQARCCLSSPR